MPELRKTPLHAFNVENGARMVDFAGWSMPVQYESIIDEHKATRSSAGLFDVSHMGEASIEGPDAEAFLDSVLTNDVSGIEIGQAMYSLICYEHGGVVDDLLVYRIAKEEFLLCLNASNTQKDIAWLNANKDALDVGISDVSDSFALLALQGPETREILKDLTAMNLDDLGYYRFQGSDVAGVSCLVCRTGYTGELGVELFVAPTDADSLARSILGAGQPYSVKLAGLGARDSLRLEAGYALYGHEISETISPVQANLMWTVKLKKASDFVGKAAIRKEKETGPKRRIVFFKTGGRRIVRAGASVLVEGEEVGSVVSGAFSPILNEAIGSALVSSNADDSKLSVDIRGNELALIPTKPPFIELKP